MEMGKLTAKLRDAVPVCLLVEGKEIKRYKNIEIPDDLKKLEYQDFKFDVPLSGAITFKIMFEPGVLPEVFPQARERRTRKPLAQEASLQEAAPAKDMAAEVEPQQEPVTLDGLPPKIIEDNDKEQRPATTTEPENIEAPESMPEALEATTEATEALVEAEAQSMDSEPAMKPARKSKGKKSVAATESVDI